MAAEGQPKPLKILTLDGGGLQAIDTLLILDRLLQIIQKQNNAPRKPRPCDVFDVISGIGAGGWLALLLGRFRLETKTCLSEWYNLLRRIAPQSRSEGLRRRVWKHSCWDEEQLVKHVEGLTQLYCTGSVLLDDGPSLARCKHVFVAAHKAQGHQKEDDYTLFRSYRVAEGRQRSSGPRDPDFFTIASAFGVTGATKYFSQPWREHTAAHGETSFFDSAFPQPHNITLPTLHEIWAIYGPDVPISIIVNIGPGIPSDHDLFNIARRFSFGLKKHSSAPSSPRKKSISTMGHPQRTENTADRNPSSAISALAYSRRNRKLLDLEARHEEKVRQQLRGRYEFPPPYFRLSLEIAPAGSVQNDSHESDAILSATEDYFASEKGERDMEEIGQTFAASELTASIDQGGAMVAA